LATIDEAAARASTARWAVVCRFFAGCARAAKAQGATPEGGGERMAEYLTAAFPYGAEASNEGFEEFMDWLSNPQAFAPTQLRAMLERIDR
jgi:hypothetical protein